MLSSLLQRTKMNGQEDDYDDDDDRVMEPNERDEVSSVLYLYIVTSDLLELIVPGGTFDETA